MVRKGDIVEIKKPYQDAGDDKLTWMAVDDEEKGKVMLVPIDSTLSIKPTYVLNVQWLRVVAKADTKNGKSSN